MIFKVQGFTFKPKCEIRSANEFAKKLKYLKIPKKPRLIVILSQNQNFFILSLLESDILIPV